MANTKVEFLDEKAIEELKRKNLERNRKRKIINGIKAGIRYGILVIVGVAMLYPLIWLLGASFKTNADIFTSIGFIPKGFKFDFTGYVNGWKTSTEYTFATYFMNTFKIVVPKVILTIISAVLTAYGFSRFKFPGKKVLFSILISTLLLPNVVLRIPQFLMYKNFGWLDSYLPLFVPAAFATDTFFVFMLIQFIRGLPKEIEEAACVDGCKSLQTLIYLSSVEKYPVALALKMSMDVSSNVNWNQILAMSIIGLTPSLIIFFGAQKHFVDGISAGGVKG